ncbi:hypothetical protein G6L37_04020 [Agrobacterium rubi]|nr:hypothetical protein [Agrobacterium rubi]NTF24517.1 hypothetical protein [Agrobacterium rubi]
MYESIIEEIIESLEGLADTSEQEQSSLFVSALSSVKASASRALIPNTRLGTLARYSVAASASSPLKKYLEGPGRSALRDGLMRDALKAAFLLAEGAAPVARDDAKVEVVPPDGWERAPNGYLVKDTPVGRAEIFHNPHMPGGDWTLNLCGVPIGYGTDPESSSLTLPAYIDFLAGPAQRVKSPNPFRSTQRAS